MKFLLVAVNAKYIHSNLGVYSLKAYAEMRLKWEDGRGKEGFLPSAVSADELTIEIGEYTINNQMDMVLKDIYQRQPDVLGFSCYIWNIDYVMELVHDIHKVLPGCDIWLGGPEVSYDAGAVLRREPAVTGIMMGEGEETFARLMEYYVNQNAEQTGTCVLAGIAGLAFRGEEGIIRENPIQPVMDMSRIPFSYGDLTGYEHKIIYYESSRGCPFSCSYCLSSIDKSVRFRDLELVKRELAFFLEHKVPQVKFVDRTFNCKKSHAMAIWQYLLEHDNGVTNFHFEISADLLDEEELSLIERMRPGLIQLEIGVQTTNPDTIREIRRTMDLEKLSAVVARINGFGNVHQHLDLIAGLPYEGYERFQQSFDDVYAMRPEQLQLGFLKVLKGSYMEEMAETYGLIYKEKPPYEVLSTNWLNYGEILKLKAVEEMVEVYYNSGQFRTTMAMLEEEFDSPFRMYEELAGEYESLGLFDVSHNRLARYEILFQFIEKRYHRLEQYRDSLMYDLYLRENVKSRPSFAREQTAYKTIVRDFFIKEAENPHYLMGYESYDSKQMSKMAHVEAMGDGSLILFDYLNRDPLNYNAKAVKINVM
ncbi:MAG: B12-binding domain-containing radical SAM protein [Hungatella hathewayi]|nr:B12-binding domain-containing radical SAM protein [Hungatella hathewayi]